MVKMSRNLLSEKDVKYFGYGKFNAATNLAIDEVLMGIASKSDKLFVRFYDFERPSIILSSSDHPDNIRFEELNGTHVSRRATGGKPIYLDENVLSYSIIGTARELNNLGKPAKLHEYFGPIIADSIREISSKTVSVELGKVYSIRVNGNPIAGHAQRLEADGTFLYHGVLAAHRWDVRKISSLLRLVPEDLSSLRSLPALDEISFVGGVSPDYKKREFVQAFLERISGKRPLEPFEEREHKEILELASDLARRKYMDEEWVYRPGVELKTSGRFCLLWEG